MQKIHILPLIGAIALGMTIFAQESQTTDMASLRGKVEFKGDKVTFVTDKGQKSWDVANPEALKGYAGHHVRIKAYVYSDKAKIRVTDVKDDDKHPCGEGGSEGVDCPPPK